MSITTYEWTISNRNGGPDFISAAYFVKDPDSPLIEFKDDQHKVVYAISVDTVLSIKRDVSHAASTSTLAPAVDAKARSRASKAGAAERLRR
jgi:hypothetical protein